MKNNFDTLRKIAVSSYDPNEKKCDPSGPVKSLPGKIRYTIYFQNIVTGCMVEHSERSVAGCVTVDLAIATDASMDKK